MILDLLGRVLGSVGVESALLGRVLGGVGVESTLLANTGLGIREFRVVAKIVPNSVTGVIDGN